MVEYANSRLIRYCPSPTTVPITRDRNAHTSSRFVPTLASAYVELAQLSTPEPDSDVIRL